MDKDKLSDNWRFTDENKPIDQNTFDEYVKNFGEQRALGYLDAIADVKAEVAWIMRNSKPTENGWRRTPSKTAKLLRDFQMHKIQFIEYVLNHSISNQDSALNQKLKQK